MAWILRDAVITEMAGNALLGCPSIDVVQVTLFTGRKYVDPGQRKLRVRIMIVTRPLPL